MNVLCGQEIVNVQKVVKENCLHLRKMQKWRGYGRKPPTAVRVELNKAKVLEKLQP